MALVVTVGFNVVALAHKVSNHVSLVVGVYVICEWHRSIGIYFDEKAEFWFGSLVCH